MARLLLNELQYRLLDVLVREGGMTLAALYSRVNSVCGAEADEVLRAAQALYDLSLVDVKVWDQTGPLAAEIRADGARDWVRDPRTRYVDDLAPEQLQRAYRHLDPFNVGAVLARGNPTEDPYYFAASHLGLGEHKVPGYAERAGRTWEDGLPPPEDLPTLPLP
jgi:hypothetical protein